MIEYIPNTLPTNRSVRLVHDDERAAFDACAPHPMQSWAWGEAREKTGLSVVRFGVFADGQMIASYQMTVHKLSKTAWCIGYIPRSLVPERLDAEYIGQWAQKHKIIFVKWEPYENNDQALRLTQIPHMYKSAHPLFTEWNLEVDLSVSIEDIYAAFSKNTRYSIRHAEKNGVVCKEMSNDEGFKIFSTLYFGTVARQKYHGHHTGFHQKIWSTLHAAGIARIYVAFYNDVPQAAFEIFFWHDRAYYPYSGSADTNRNIPSTQALMWFVIQQAKEAGMHTLDLWGSLPPEHDKAHPWSGFTFFKKGFGSQFVAMSPTYDYVVFRGLYRLYGAAYRLRSLLWKQNT